MPDGAVPGTADRRLRKFLLRRLQLLQADDVRPGLRQPAQQHRQAAIDAIDVVGRDLHSRFMNDARQPREPPGGDPVANPSEFKYRSAASNGLNTRNSAAFRVRSGRGETVDAADLKSAPRKGVWVRLPSSAPTQRSQGTEDAREPRSSARIFRGNVSLLTGLDRGTRLERSQAADPAALFLTLAAARCGALPIESRCRGTGSAPSGFFFREHKSGQREHPP